MAQDRLSSLGVLAVEAKVVVITKFKRSMELEEWIKWSIKGDQDDKAQNL